MLLLWLQRMKRSKIFPHFLNSFASICDMFFFILFSFHSYKFNLELNPAYVDNNSDFYLLIFFKTSLINCTQFHFFLFHSYVRTLIFFKFEFNVYPSIAINKRECHIALVHVTFMLHTSVP